MKNTARKTRPTEATRPQLPTFLGEAARNARLAHDLGDLMRRDLRQFVISAGTAALAMVLERERTEIVGPRYAHLCCAVSHWQVLVAIRTCVITLPPCLASSLAGLEQLQSKHTSQMT